MEQGRSHVCSRVCELGLPTAGHNQLTVPPQELPQRAMWAGLSIPHHSGQWSMLRTTGQGAVLPDRKGPQEMKIASRGSLCKGGICPSCRGTASRVCADQLLATSGRRLCLGLRAARVLVRGWPSALATHQALRESCETRTPGSQPSRSCSVGLRTAWASGVLPASWAIPVDGRRRARGEVWGQ